MSDKPKFPRAAALAVAKELCDALKPRTERLIVAGSLRRRKEMVGDVEIIYIPRRVELEGRKADLFAPPERIQIDEVVEKLDDMFVRGVIGKRRNSIGSVMWGEKNKLAVHADSGIPVDFFATTEDAWFNYLVCRTGGAENNVAICNAAIAKGWKWNPYGSGFSRALDDEKFVVKSERDVFEFIGLPFKEPWER